MQIRGEININSTTWTLHLCLFLVLRRLSEACRIFSIYIQTDASESGYDTCTHYCRLSCVSFSWLSILLLHKIYRNASTLINHFVAVRLLEVFLAGWVASRVVIILVNEKNWCDANTTVPIHSLTRHITSLRHWPSTTGTPSHSTVPLVQQSPPYI